MSNSTSKEVILGISGSISAYKAIDVIRLLRKQGIGVQPVFSNSAHHFVTPWTVETLSENPLINDGVQLGRISHLDICARADAFIICPASANCIAKLAKGMANDILSASFLSFTGPKIIFPAMHTEMYDNPITQANIETLKHQGIRVIEPDSGDLACGDVGKGRLPHGDLISDIIQFSLLPPLDLTGQHITISCGGTTEPIDSVRAITNHATGMSGHKLANLAALYGADVTLVRTSPHPILSTIKPIDVCTAQDMHDEVLKTASVTTTLIMNAAVSDFMVKNTSQQKLSRHDTTSLELIPTPDILAAFNKIKRQDCKSIGFCLDDASDLITIAKNKQKKKNCDIIIANNSQSFGQSIRNVHIIDQQNIASYQNISLYELSHNILKYIL
jgi:phosphopantothenoylcysteine decarboxylase/phosphopantothenate--cysteine ligase